MNNKEFQYYHANNQDCDYGTPSFTAVCIVPEKKFLIEMINLAFNHKDIVLPMYFGYTNVHEDDQYNKEIGRLMAKINMKYQKFRLLNITYDSGYTNVRLINDLGDLVLLEMKASRNTVYFTGVEF